MRLLYLKFDSSRSLLKSEDITTVHDQNFLHAMLFKAVFPLSEEFQSNVCVEMKILAIVPLNCR